MYGVFVSLDLFVFFLFYEIAVLPMYLLIGIWGSSGEVRPQGIFGWALGRTGVGTKEYAAMKLTLYLLFGSAFILVGILALFVATGSQSFSFLTMSAQQFDPALQTWVFLAFYVGFGILAGIWPLHTWSPDGHASAPTAVSMLHAGVLMKLGRLRRRPARHGTAARRRPSTGPGSSAPSPASTSSTARSARWRSAT